MWSLAPHWMHSMRHYDFRFHDGPEMCVDVIVAILGYNRCDCVSNMFVNNVTDNFAAQLRCKNIHMFGQH